MLYHATGSSFFEGCIIFYCIYIYIYATFSSSAHLLMDFWLTSKTWCCDSAVVNMRVQKSLQDPALSPWDGYPKGGGVA